MFTGYIILAYFQELATLQCLDVDLKTSINFNSGDSGSITVIV